MQQNNFRGGGGVGRGAKLLDREPGHQNAKAKRRSVLQARTCCQDRPLKPVSARCWRRALEMKAAQASNAFILASDGGGRRLVLGQG